MSEIEPDKITKSLSLVLRHNKDKALTLDEHGYADIDELCSYLSTLSRYPNGFRKEWVYEALKLPGKTRFGLSQDGNKIRALSGHSFEVDLGYPPYEPKGELYFGTTTLAAHQIVEHGLTKSTKVKVRLVETSEEAYEIAKTRDGVPLVIAVDALSLKRDGYAFELAESGEIITDKIPAKYCSTHDIGSSPRF